MSGWPDRGEELLARLADRRQPPLEASDVAVVFAHPDDETIGCGAQLERLRDATLILVSNGAPANQVDAKAHGFATAQGYANARRAELRQALALAGVPERALVCLEVPDQEIAFRLVEIVERLTVLLAARNVGVVITHCYEGGHPDHDATAFAVHAALARLGASGIIEMPLYRQGASGEQLRQQFSHREDHPEITVSLSAVQRALKQQMVAAHATQREVIAGFELQIERFRRAPAYDFVGLPNSGRILYDHYDWGLTSARWLELASVARARLGLEGKL